MCFASATEVASDREATVKDTSVLTYAQIIQGLANWLTGNQQTTSGACEGGWDYAEKETRYRSENSVSGYATLGLGLAQALAGLTIPVANLNHLDVFIDGVQKSGGV